MSQRNKIAIYFTSNFSLVILKTNDFTTCGLFFFINKKINKIEYQIQGSLARMALILWHKVISMILTCTLQKENWSKQIYLYTNKQERKMLHLKIGKSVSQWKKKHKSSMI